ncbi:MAG: hypothetical protein ACI4QR_01530 [Eubacteriales bacterium]
MEFLDWSFMATYSGSLVMVLVITQITKNLGFVKKIPTQLWSYVIAIAVLICAYLFTGKLTLSNIVLILFNGMLVALSANGGFEALSKTFPQLFKSNKN